MRVILLQDIKNIGKRGDIEEVSDGYARNFLFPKKLAETATEIALKRVEALKNKFAEKEQVDLEKTQKLAEQLQGREIIINAKEKEGKLFGSITAKNLAKELKKENFIINEKSIILPEPIKETGEYEVKLELDHGIESFIKVIVESEN